MWNKVHRHKTLKIEELVTKKRFVDLNNCGKFWKYFLIFQILEYVNYVAFKD